MAILNIRDSANTPRQIKLLQVRDATNTPRNILRVYARDSNNVPQLIFFSGSIVVVGASPNPAVVGIPAGSMSTPTVTGTVTGGLLPYTAINWTLVTTSGGSPFANSPTSLATKFSTGGLAPGASITAIFRLTVTDSAAQSAHVDVTCVFTNTSGP